MARSLLVGWFFGLLDTLLAAYVAARKRGRGWTECEAGQGMSSMIPHTASRHSFCDDLLGAVSRILYENFRECRARDLYGLARWSRLPEEVRAQPYMRWEESPSWAVSGSERLAGVRGYSGAPLCGLTTLGLGGGFSPILAFRSSYGCCAGNWESQ